MFGLLALVCAFLSAFPAFAVERNEGVPGAEVRVQGSLLTGQPVTAYFDLKGYSIPNGSYASVNIRFEKKPSGVEPKVSAGYPESVLVFKNPGTYHLTFIINEVSKPSCGGVEAKLLLEKSIMLKIDQ